MTKDQKVQEINDLTGVLNDAAVLYIADTSELSVATINDFRRACFGKGITLKVVKNTLLKKAMENVEGKDYSELYDVLKGGTAIMTSEVGNAPAKLIQDFRKKATKPAVKAAWIEEAVFIGDHKLQTLADIKSKEELLGEIIGLLQSPAKNVVSALKSGGNTIAGLVKTLSEREQ